MKGKNISIQKIYNKGSREVNEDELLIERNMFGVFDGMGTLVKFKDKKGRTGGKLAASITKQVFSENEKSLTELAIKANSKIVQKMKKERIDIKKKENLWGTFAAVVRVKGNEAECFQIGDCLILLVYKNNFYELLFGYKDHDLKTLIMWKELGKKKVENIWEALKHQTDKIRKEVNVKYGCLNGEKSSIKFFNFKRIKLNNIKSLILFTDGIFIPKEEPRAPEDWKLFIDIYQNKGLKGLLNYIRSLEESDPNCWNYPRFKKHDDVAAIGIDFK